MNKKFIVITTIQEKTESILRFEKEHEWNLILIGDEKSPKISSSKNTRFLSLDEQLDNLKMEYPKVCPRNHYSRKNIGYALAYKSGAEIIYDTDDDNSPLANWSSPKFTCDRIYTTNSEVVNVYKHFTEKKVWPRGLPIDMILSEEKGNFIKEKTKVGVWQGLANGEPDVDAIYRLTIGEQVTFEKRKPFVIQKNAFSPFNSQNTFWNKDLIFLMYLPSTVSFRFTDILRGYIAQRIMWEYDYHLGFTEATVYQDRNEHNLMKDFDSEISMYTQTDRVIKLLKNLTLGTNFHEDMLTTYGALSKEGIVKDVELTNLKAWMSDINSK